MARFELKSKIPQLTGEMRKRASLAVRGAALQIEGEAKLRAPVDTGFLRNSIQTTVDNDLQATVTVGAEYGAYVELGTSRMAAQPYFLPAIESVRSDFEKQIAAILK